MDLPWWGPKDGLCMGFGEGEGMENEMGNGSGDSRGKECGETTDIEKD